MAGYRGKNSARGGRREGKVGTAYKNRSDLNAARAPIQAVRGGEYGSGQASIEAQRAVPVASAPVAGGPPPPPAVPDHLPRPGELPGLTAPSTDPNEHIMSGAVSGPGPGPAAFGFDEKTQGDNEVAWVKGYIPTMEFLANSERGGDAARQVVRMLKVRTGLIPGGTLDGSV